MDSVTATAFGAIAETLGRQRRTGAQLAQQAAWYQDGRCIGCGWMLEVDELAAGFEKCGECDDGSE